MSMGMVKKRVKDKVGKKLYDENKKDIKIRITKVVDKFIKKHDL